VHLRVERRSLLPIARYLVIGVGAAFVIAGAVLLDQTFRASQQYGDSVTRDPVTSLPSTDYSRAAYAEHNARAFEIAAITSLAIGGAAAAVGLALFAVHTRPPARGAAIVATPQGVGVAF